MYKAPEGYLRILAKQKGNGILIYGILVRPWEDTKGYRDAYFFIANQI